MNGLLEKEPFILRQLLSLSQQQLLSLSLSQLENEWMPENEQLPENEPYISYSFRLQEFELQEYEHHVLQQFKLSHSNSGSAGA